MSNARYTAENVAQYVIQHGQQQGTPPSHLALQKTLYFLQRDWLQRTGAPLFDEDFEAWRFGPVVRSIYKEYNLFCASPIHKTFKNTPYFAPEDRAQMDRVIHSCQVRSPWDLVSETHKPNTAWSKVWDNERGYKQVIPKSLILQCDVNRDNAELVWMP